MNIKYGLNPGVIFCCLSFCAVSAVAGGKQAPWLGRPWELSYIVQVDNLVGMKANRRLGLRELAKANLDDPQIPASVFDWEVVSIPSPEKLPYSGDGHIAVLSIRFDRDGLVKVPYSWRPGLKAHIDSIYKVKLTEGDSADGLKFDLGYWYTGASSDESIYVPAICTITDMEARYKKGFDKNGVASGNFGCREWGYYLQSREHPYIDITSYQKQGAYIRPVVGWGRFDIPAKPVIGKVLDTWLCLYDCPDDEAPGVIPDISAWAEKRNWPIPKPPKRLPMFVDKARKAGEFVD